MADANAVLKALGAASSSLTVTGVMNALGLSAKAGERDARKKVIANLACLMKRDLVSQTWPRQEQFGEPRPVALYQITETGRTALEAGARVFGGAKTRAVKVLRGTRRQKFWAALRIAGKFTVSELAEAACSRGDKPRAAMKDAGEYLRALKSAGIVAEMSVRARGHAPTSNGFKRFALIKDVGPLAPVAGKRGLFNPNNRQTIPYQVEVRS